MTRKTAGGLGLAMILAGVLVGSAVLPDFAPTAVHAQDKDTESPLGKAMDTLDTGMKKLRRLVRKEDGREEALQYVVEMEQAALAAKGMTAPMLEKVAEADRPAFSNGYRKEMAELVIQLLNLETALIDGNSEKAQELYDGLKDLKKTGHERYTEDG